MSEHLELVFPEGFLWGTATSSHQVEGANHLNDWWEFEHQSGRIHDGSVSGDACRHFELYRSDLELIQSLHQNSHRFSLEWSRIEPEEGRYDSAAIDHYRSVLETMRSLGIEPMLTIHHFTNPLWLARKGGWESPGVVGHFERLVRLIASEYGDLVRYWVTINEPMVYAVMGYLLLHWPPAKSSISLAFRCAANFARAHVSAYRVLHERAQRPPMVGIAHNMRIFDPASSGSWLDQKAARLQDYVFNEVFLNCLHEGKLKLPLGTEVLGSKETLDFIGLNYYSRDLVSFDLGQPSTLFGRNAPSPDAELSLFGWEVYPEGIYRLCKRLSSYGRPIFITENGLPDEDDSQRSRFLLDHLTWLHRAISEGIDVRGYYHWSFIDNFEWAEGYATPFGLVAFDPVTYERTVKESGRLYAEICRSGRINAAMRAAAGRRAAKQSRNLNLYGKKETVC